MCFACVLHHKHYFLVLVFSCHMLISRFSVSQNRQKKQETLRILLLISQSLSLSAFYNRSLSPYISLLQRTRDHTHHFTFLPSTHLPRRMPAEGMHMEQTQAYTFTPQMNAHMHASIYMHACSTKAYSTNASSMHERPDIYPQASPNNCRRVISGSENMLKTQDLSQLSRPLSTPSSVHVTPHHQ